MPKLKTLEYVNKILSRVKIENGSCVDFNFQWEAKEIHEGFLIRAGFDRLDIYTRQIGKGYGRWMYIEKDSTESGIVKTAWLCFELITRHEEMEAFRYKGINIFNPHKSVKHLAYPKELE